MLLVVCQLSRDVIGLMLRHTIQLKRTKEKKTLNNKPNNGQKGFG